MGDNLPFVSLGTGVRVTSVVGGGGDNGSSCALLSTGALKCWGYGWWGHLGLGDRTSRGDEPNEMGDNLPSVNVGTGLSPIHVATTAWHTCVILNDMSVRCWGDNFLSQLGLENGERDDWSATSIIGDGPGEMGDALHVVRVP